MTVINLRIVSLSGRIKLSPAPVKEGDGGTKILCHWWDEKSNSFKKEEFDDFALEKDTGPFVVA